MNYINCQANATNNCLRRWLFVIITMWMLLALVFAFTDLQISIAVVNAQSPWGIFLENFGEIPGMLVGVSALFIVGLVLWQQHQWSHRFWSIMMAILNAYALNYILLRCVVAISGNYQLFIDHGTLILASAFLAILSGQIIAAQTKITISQRIMVFAKVSIGVILINFVLFVQIGKSLWGRVRFVNLDASYSQYTPWYLPQGPNGHRSFPSGHACMGWLLLPLLILAWRHPRKTVRIAACIVVIGWGVAVAVSRVYIGKHYASDVLFSSGVGIVAFLMLTRYRNIQCP